jgi:hypothetical protein
LVSARAVLAFCTLASAPSTAACADGTLPADEADAPEPEPPAEPPEPPAEPPEPPAEPPALEPAPVALGELVVVWLDVAGRVGAAGAGVVDGVVGVDDFVVVVDVVDDVPVVVGGGVALVPVLEVVVVGVVGEVVPRLVVSETNSVVPALVWSDALVVDVVVEGVVAVDELLSAELSWSSAAVRFCSAWSTASWAELESSVASSCPLFTCWPTCTYTCERVPLVWKFTFRSVPASTFPVPDTVDCTTPFAAVTICVEVRAELAGGPISATAKATSVRAATPRT